MRGDILKDIHEKCGMDREELANAVCVTESIIQSWEQGWYIQPPSSGEIEAMAECFRISEADLLEMLEINEESLSDSAMPRFIDFVDAAVKCLDYTKDRTKE